MTITVPKGYESHGSLPDGTMLFSNKEYSISIKLDEQDQIVSVNARGISRTKESAALHELQKFSITAVERFFPQHRHNAIYFRILNEQKKE